jgi:hypothetical protein
MVGRKASLETKLQTKEAPEVRRLEEGRGEEGKREAYLF